MQSRHYHRIFMFIVLLGLVLFIITGPVLDPLECGEERDWLGPSVIIFASFYVAVVVFLGIACGKGHMSLWDALAAVVVLVVTLFLWLILMSIVPTC